MIQELNWIEETKMIIGSGSLHCFSTGCDVVEFEIICRTELENWLPIEPQLSLLWPSRFC